MAKIAVAPLVGAWIEIAERWHGSESNSSLPSWERGLKFMDNNVDKRLVMSLPSWERGLKLHLFIFILSNLCRSPRGSVD